MEPQEPQPDTANPLSTVNPMVSPTPSFGTTSSQEGMGIDRRGALSPPSFSPSAFSRVPPGTTVGTDALSFNLGEPLNSFNGNSLGSESLDSLAFDPSLIPFGADSTGASSEVTVSFQSQGMPMPSQSRRASTNPFTITPPSQEPQIIPPPNDFTSSRASLLSETSKKVPQESGHVIYVDPTAERMARGSSFTQEPPEATGWDARFSDEEDEEIRSLETPKTLPKESTSMSSMPPARLTESMAR